jgi:hypothetical protein
VQYEAPERFNRRLRELVKAAAVPSEAR